MQLSVPTYYGGKGGGQGTRGTGAWIASLLPWEHDSLYVEPFCGMCGVLLQRSPCHKELINDLDGLVTNFWRVVRDNSGEFQRLCEATPRWSRPDFNEAWEIVEENNLEEPIRLAWAFIVVSSWSLMQNRKPHTYPKLQHMGSQAKKLNDHPWEQVSQRLAGVLIEQRNAIELIDKMINLSHVVGYCDPPYKNADTSPYGAKVDHDQLIEVLLPQQGRWAVSGYEDDFPELEQAGWIRHTHETWLAAASSHKDSKRVECLWTNYQVGQQTLW